LSLKAGRPHYIEAGKHDNDLLVMYSEANYYSTMHEHFFGNLLDDSKMLKIQLGSRSENEILTK
jgi:hypothetical protein